MAVTLLQNPASLDTLKTGAPNELVSYGGAGVVLNTDSATATADADDVYALLAAATTIRAIPVYTGAYLFLSHHWTDVTAASINQAPVVRVFGHIPNHNIQQRSHPQDIDTDFMDVHDSGFVLGSKPRLDARGLWVPLTTPGYTAGTPGLTLDNIGCRNVFNTTQQYTVSEEKYVFLAGCDLALVVVSTAATYTSGTDPKGVIVGRLVG